jgi:hypothetical protein
MKELDARQIKKDTRCFIFTSGTYRNRAIDPLQRPEKNKSWKRSNPPTESSTDTGKFFLLPVMTHYKQDTDDHEWKSNYSNNNKAPPNGEMVAVMIDKIDKNTKDKA